MPMVSAPFTLIDPFRAPVSPMMARSVVVRPAPLRPSSVTTSPWFTCRSTPCRMCDSPYHACRSLISRAVAMSVPDPFKLRGGRAHVGFLDRRVAGDLGIRPFGEHRAARQHGDRVGDARHDV